MNTEELGNLCFLVEKDNSIQYIVGKYTFKDSIIRNTCTHPFLFRIKNKIIKYAHNIIANTFTNTNSSINISIYEEAYFIRDTISYFAHTILSKITLLYLVLPKSHKPTFNTF